MRATRWIWGGCRGALMVTALLVLGSTTAAAEAEFFDLGMLPGGQEQTRANAVSEDGRVVVGRSNSTEGGQAFRWTEEEGIVGLGDLPGGGFFSTAHGIADDGSVIVGHSNSLPSGREAFRLQDSVSLEDDGMGLGFLPMASTFDSQAFDCSADCSVVVGNSTSPNAQGSGMEAYRWTAETGMVGLGDLDGGLFDSGAAACSADGSVVVGSSVIDSVPLAKRQAFRWTAETGMVALGTLGDGITESGASGISADGSLIVGHVATGTDSREAVIWTAEGETILLGELPGGDYWSSAGDLSADGSVVIGSSRTELGSEAFIWDDVHGIRSLQDMIELELGIDLSDWTRLSNANDITDDGRNIVGFGLRDGVDQAFLLRLPEPAPALGSLVALACLAGLRAARPRRG